MAVAEVSSAEHTHFSAPLVLQASETRVGGEALLLLTLQSTEAKFKI